MEQTRVMKLLRGNHTMFKATFRKDATDDVMYLVGMIGKIVKVSSMTHMVLLAVISSHSWDGDNRTFTLELMPEIFADEGRQWFIGRMARALEKFEVALWRTP